MRQTSLDSPTKKLKVQSASELVSIKQDEKLLHDRSQRKQPLLTTSQTVGSKYLDTRQQSHRIQREIDSFLTVPNEDYFGLNHTAIKGYYTFIKSKLEQQLLRDKHSQQSKVTEQVSQLMSQSIRMRNVKKGLIAGCQQTYKVLERVCKEYEGRQEQYGHMDFSSTIMKTMGVQLYPNVQLVSLGFAELREIDWQGQVLLGEDRSPTGFKREQNTDRKQTDIHLPSTFGNYPFFLSDVISRRESLSISTPMLTTIYYQYVLTVTLPQSLTKNDSHDTSQRQVYAIVDENIPSIVFYHTDLKVLNQHFKKWQNQAIEEQYSNEDMSKQKDKQTERVIQKDKLENCVLKVQGKDNKDSIFANLIGRNMFRKKRVVRCGMRVTGRIPDLLYPYRIKKNILAQLVQLDKSNEPSSAYAVSLGWGSLLTELLTQKFRYVRKSHNFETATAEQPLSENEKFQNIIPPLISPFYVLQVELTTPPSIKSLLHSQLCEYLKKMLIINNLKPVSLMQMFLGKLAKTGVVMEILGYRDYGEKQKEKEKESEKDSYAGEKKEEDQKLAIWKIAIQDPEMYAEIVQCLEEQSMDFGPFTFNLYIDEERQRSFITRKFLSISHKAPIQSLYSYQVQYANAKGRFKARKPIYNLLVHNSSLPIHPYANSNPVPSFPQFDTTITGQSHQQCFEEFLRCLLNRWTFAEILSFGKSFIDWQIEQYHDLSSKLKSYYRMTRVRNRVLDSGVLDKLKVKCQGLRGEQKQRVLKGVKEGRVYCGQTGFIVAF